jgi:hypothetical protein
VRGLGSPDAALPIVAQVEWRSERRWAELPRALLVGGERLEIDIVDRWVEGPATAGRELVRCFVVADGAGVLYLIRHASSGHTVVMRLPPR